MIYTYPTGYALSVTEEKVRQLVLAGLYFIETRGICLVTRIPADTVRNHHTNQREFWEPLARFLEVVCAPVTGQEMGIALSHIQYVHVHGWAPYLAKLEELTAEQKNYRYLYDPAFAAYVTAP